MNISDFQKIGIGLVGFGMFFNLMGVMLMFDKGLLAIGNLLFLGGVTMIIGLERTIRFFFQRHKLKGTSFFMGGIFIVLFGYPVIGMVLETYGFLSLFGGFIPTIVGFARNIPGLNLIFAIPFINRIAIQVENSKSMV
ncbi:vesicle transport protein GOT1B-like isoform X2 [Convolutriloba macropyga]|uniref:vesicle transport protein GOT1B-like isoform X2 n=1 Tax=Convolutriloba macropyga TaxID=536237 RepID=UPI003F5275BC